jgi:hypothetical protein
MAQLDTRDLAQLLLTDEAAADKTSGSTESTAFRVYERLRHHLCALAGVAGFHALASRALTLAKAKVSSLGAIQVAADGSLQMLSEAESESDKRQACEGEVILVSELLGLLHAFIGEALTLRLLRDAWPNAVFDGCDSGDGEKHERTR